VDRYSHIESKKNIMSDWDDISTALASIRSRLDTLASINADNILLPGGLQAGYHAMIEEAYAALSLIETQLDELQAELEYQHKRLDEIRDTALAQAGETEEQLIAFRDED